MKIKHDVNIESVERKIAPSGTYSNPLKDFINSDHSNMCVTFDTNEEARRAAIAFCTYINHFKLGLKVSKLGLSVYVIKK